ICFFLKTFWTIDELITALQVFQASCNTERYLYIETYQEPYDDGYSARAFFKGWRPMTADELKEANELRKVTKTEQQAAMELYRQREIERARSLL
ncbi:hypothetical protein LRR18_18340, partial [Mangrovimonas sp. AS39]|uniref:hypothetical protein n=1 Tax=Mangrovimonas futianensis TaxID=2895523 RepID=UPI001E5BE8FC